MSRYLRYNTAARVTVGPFLDPTDGVTPEIALTATNCLLTLVVDTGGVPTLVLDAAATASGGDNDLVHVTSDAAGFYDLELTAAQVNYLGRAILSITDATNHCPVFHEFTILPQQVYDSLVLGTDLLDANASQVGGTTQTGRDLGASVLLSSGTGTGQLDFTAGVVKANLAQILGTALTETAGLIAAGFKKFFNVATPTGTVNSLPAAAPDAAGGLPISDAGGLDLDAIPTTLTEMKGATFAGATDSLEAIRDRGDAAWITGSGGTPLTAQETRDALKLAPTAGAPDAGSVDAELDAILLETAEIGAAGANLTALGDARLANLDAAVSTRLAPAGTLATVTAVTNDVGITQAGADKVWGSAARTLTSFGTLIADIWASATRTLTAAADSSGVTTLLTRIIGTLAAGTHTAQTGDAFARLGVPAGASVSADVAAVKAETAAILEGTGTTLPALITSRSVPTDAGAGGAFTAGGLINTPTGGAAGSGAPAAGFFTEAE